MNRQDECTRQRGARTRTIFTAFSLLMGAMGCPRAPTVATRPELLPFVVIEINDTPTQSDDYAGSGSSVPARIRVLNGSKLPAPVGVTLKNIEFQSAPQLVFSTSGPPTLPSLDLTLPLDGTWVPLRLGPAAGQASVRDKDAIVEILEHRADGIVLGRKSLMVGATAPTVGPAVEIQITEAPNIDDYIGWRPVNARVRLATASALPVDVRIRNMAPVVGGRLTFGGIPPLDSEVVLPPTMAVDVDLTLPANGDWVSFYVAGAFGSPSTNDKDAVLEVVRAGTTQVLGREGLMVRVRKNANFLSAIERQRFVEAVARANMGLGAYGKHQDIHAIVDLPDGFGGLLTSQGHQGPAFLAWHRPYILRLEAELQAIDPGVALHYWRFDEPAPAVFNSDFMGGPPVSGLVTFDPAHPFAVWTIDGFAGILRVPTFSPTGIPSGIFTQTATLALGGPANAFSSFRTMEGNPHGRAHVRTSPSTSVGWIGQIPTAARDPLFFMLHSNVDHLWAMWQWLNLRDDPSSADAYSPQGEYPVPGSGTIWLGHYANDSMWPWDLRTGEVVAGDSRTRRPASAPGGRMPVLLAPAAALQVPRPRDLIDYDRWTLLGRSGLGYSYDDVPFSQP